LAGLGVPVGTARHEAIVAKALSAPLSCRGSYMLAASGRSMASAQKAGCLECMGWVRSDIDGCTALSCPHYPYRPFQGGQDTPDDEFGASPSQEITKEKVEKSDDLALGVSK
jgi:hypothetical protein